jgi:hypothetical protein
MVDCFNCKHLTKHDIDDIECYCTKKMFEKFSYKVIKECEYFETKNNKM